APQFGSRQQIARQLAQRGHKILFVNIARTIHSFVSDPSGTRQALRRLGQVSQIDDNLSVYTPWPLLPIYYNPLINSINQPLFLADLRRLLKRLNWQIDVLWSYWPNTAYLIGRLRERVSVYHCIDDFVAVGYPLTTRNAIASMEAKQCRKVDLILTRTVGLNTLKKEYNPNTHLLPGGVDLTHFNPEVTRHARADVKDLPSPRVGLLGTIDDRVDVPLLTYCAQALPDITFAFVGPVKHHRVNLSTLTNLPNVHLLPACTYAEVPAIMNAFDVCLIPYLLNSYTRALSPIKLYEYLALGKPVIATELPYLMREADTITIAKSPSDFVTAIQTALTLPITASEKADRRAVAAQQAWSHQVDQIENYLALLLEP
ncbi:MAG: glycosyltransferase, partial [Chloroflexota bacterium]